MSNFVKFFNTGLPHTMVTVYVTAHTLFKKLYVPVTVHGEQSVKKEYQQDATI